MVEVPIFNLGGSNAPQVGSGGNPFAGFSNLFRNQRPPRAATENEKFDRAVLNFSKKNDISSNPTFWTQGQTDAFGAINPSYLDQVTQSRKNASSVDLTGLSEDNNTRVQNAIRVAEAEFETLNGPGSLNPAVRKSLAQQAINGVLAGEALNLEVKSTEELGGLVGDTLGGQFYQVNEIFANSAKEVAQAVLLNDVNLAENPEWASVISAGMGGSGSKWAEKWGQSTITKDNIVDFITDTSRALNSWEKEVYIEQFKQQASNKGLTNNISEQDLNVRAENAWAAFSKENLKDESGTSTSEVLAKAMVNSIVPEAGTETTKNLSEGLRVFENWTKSSPSYNNLVREVRGKLGAEGSAVLDEHFQKALFSLYTGVPFKADITEAPVIPGSEVSPLTKSINEIIPTFLNVLASDEFLNSPEGAEDLSSLRDRQAAIRFHLRQGSTATGEFRVRENREALESLLQLSNTTLTSDLSTPTMLLASEARVGLTALTELADQHGTVPQPSDIEPLTTAVAAGRLPGGVLREFEEVTRNLYVDRFQKGTGLESTEKLAELGLRVQLDFSDGKYSTSIVLEDGEGLPDLAKQTFTDALGIRKIQFLVGPKETSPKDLLPDTKDTVPRTLTDSDLIAVFDSLMNGKPITSKMLGVEGSTNIEESIDDALAKAGLTRESVKGISISELMELTVDGRTVGATLLDEDGESEANYANLKKSMGWLEEGVTSLGETLNGTESGDKITSDIVTALGGDTKKTMDFAVNESDSRTGEEEPTTFSESRAQVAETNQGRSLVEFTNTFLTEKGVPKAEIEAVLKEIEATGEAEYLQKMRESENTAVYFEPSVLEVVTSDLVGTDWNLAVRNAIYQLTNTTPTDAEIAGAAGIAAMQSSFPARPALGETPDDEVTTTVLPDEATEKLIEGVNEAIDASEESGGDFQKGLDAYKSGDYATALREWSLLAEQGYSGAQYNLGKMYKDGLGVPEDYAEAARWYRLAAEQGDERAKSWADNLEGKISLQESQADVELGKAEKRLATMPVTKRLIERVESKPGLEGYKTLWANWEQPGGRYEGTDITTMSLGQLFKFADDGYHNANNLNSAPFGKFQFLDSTLKDLTNRMPGITEDTIFTPENQLAMFTWYAKDRLGNRQGDAAVSKLIAIWEGLGKGDVAYDDILQMASEVRGTPTEPPVPVEYTLPADTKNTVGVGGITVAVNSIPRRNPEGEGFNAPPIFGTSGEQPHTPSPKNMFYAEGNMQKLMAKDGPFHRVQGKMSSLFPNMKPVRINDALVHAGSTRENTRPPTGTGSGSQHFHGTALDVSIVGMSKKQKIALWKAAYEEGFRGFGFGNNILHMDMSNARVWGYGEIAKNKVWEGISFKDLKQGIASAGPRGGDNFIVGSRATFEDDTGDRAVEDTEGKQGDVEVISFGDYVLPQGIFGLPGMTATSPEEIFFQGDPGITPEKPEGGAGGPSGRVTNDSGGSVSATSPVVQKFLTSLSEEQQTSFKEMLQSLGKEDKENFLNSLAEQTEANGTGVNVR